MSSLVRQARSRAQGSIGVPPVFPNGVQDDDQKLAGRTSHREPFADLQPSFRDTGETPMLPSARRHAAPKARRESSLLEMSKLQRLEAYASFEDVFIPAGGYARQHLRSKGYYPHGRDALGRRGTSP